MDTRVLTVRRRQIFALLAFPALALSLTAAIANPKQDVVTIEVRWEGGAEGYPTADDVKITRKLGKQVKLVWVPAAGSEVTSVDYIRLDRNPNGMLAEVQARGDGAVTALNTVRGKAAAKYVITATHRRHGQRVGPDPEIENEVEP